jgi:hypothetical protein
VVGAGGKLLIREPYASLQRKLLDSENVAVVEARVKMAQHAWEPAKQSAKRKIKPKSKKKSTRGQRRTTAGT